MANVNNASARLRKTFHYPADDDASNSDPEAMDEQGTYLPAHSPCLPLPRSWPNISLRARILHRPPHRRKHNPKHPIPHSPPRPPHPLLPPVPHNRLPPENNPPLPPRPNKIGRAHV